VKAVVMAGGEGTRLRPLTSNQPKPMVPIVGKPCMEHIVELLITRTLILAPIYVLGFSKEVIDAYIVIVGFQAVFNHANVSVRLGPLRYLIVTPNFHHWHHSQDDEAIDRNYAAHFAFIDHVFGTAVQSDRQWPERYGVVGDYVPDGFFKQLAFPFVWKR